MNSLGLTPNSDLKFLEKCAKLEYPRLKAISEIVIEEKNSNHPEKFYTKTCTFLASTPKRSNVLYTQLQISEFLKLVTI